MTALLQRWRGGDLHALEELTPLVYSALHRVAARRLRREHAHTLQATALVHEAYLRLVDQRPVDWRNRAHFFAVASRVMRHLLVDHGRARNAAKRGGPALRIGLDSELPEPERDLELLRLDTALERLAEVDVRHARVVELRYFGGLTVEETAEALGSSPATVKRDFALARAWLRRQLAVEG